MKYSLGIPTFNRDILVIENFKRVLDDERIDEIIINDDFSNIEVYNNLNLLISELKSDKIKLYRNDKNLKPFLNKCETVKKCKNDWVILIDSDNYLDKSYIDNLDKYDLDENIIYCPQVLKNEHNWSYERFKGVMIDSNYAKNEVINLDGISNFNMFLNTGNYCVNRKNYVSTIENDIEYTKNITLTIIDTLYFSYLWLKKHKYYIIPEQYYYHRIHDGSFYINNINISRISEQVILNRIKTEY